MQRLTKEESKPYNSDKVQSLDSALKLLDDWNDVDKAYIFTRDHEAARGKDVLKQTL
jgi:hypothetical protein